MDENILQLTRRQLYELVWRTPVDTLARELGISGRGLGKLCERHAIPVPPRGYWARKSAGQKVKRMPLPELTGSGRPEIVVDLRLRREYRGVVPDGGETEQDRYTLLYERQLSEIEAVRVAKRLHNPHPVIAGWLRQEEAERRREHEWSYGRSSCESRYASSLARRRLRILDALFRELERRGCAIRPSDDLGRKLRVELGRDTIEFTLAERIRQTRRRLSDEEKSERHASKRAWVQERVATGALELRLSTSLPATLPGKWQDEPDSPLEGQCRQVLAGMLSAIGVVRERRERQEEAERQRLARAEEQRRQEAERQARRERELGLRQRAEAWRVAGDIRSYVAAVETASGARGAFDSEAFETWKRWALGHADAIDPIVSGDATGTVPLWEDEPHGEPGRRPVPGPGSRADTDWHWGRRWWLRR